MGTARYGASGALSGAERTGKDNAVAIYWAMLKLYAGARPHFRMYGTLARAHAHIPPFVRIRLACGWSRECYLGYRSAVDGARMSNKVTINRKNEPRRGRRFSEGRGERTPTIDDELHAFSLHTPDMKFKYFYASGKHRCHGIIMLNVIYNLCIS